MSVGSWRSVVSLVSFVIANVIVIHPLEFEFLVPIFVQAIGSRFFRFVRELCSWKCSTVPQGEEDARLRFRLKLDYVMAPVGIVFFLWAITAIDSDVIRQGIVGANGVQPLSIMALFISLAYLTVSLDKTGLFGFLAVWVARRGKSSGRRLFLLLYLFFFLCAALFGNDPVVLSGTPFLAHFARYSGIDPPTAWIFAQFIPANTASAILPPSNPTNLVVTSAFSISFLSFAAHTVIPTLAVAISQFILLRYVQFNSPAFIPKAFSLDSIQPDSQDDVEVSSRPSSSRLRASSGEQHNIGRLSDKPGAVFGSALFISTLLVLLGTSVRRIPVWWVTTPSAVIMAIRDIFHDRKRLHIKPLIRSRVANETGSTACEGSIGTSLAHSRSQPRRTLQTLRDTFETRLPTFGKVLEGLPLAMLPFAFAMFILVQALTVSGWIEVFSKWWAAWVNVCGPTGSLRAVTGTVFGMLIISVLMCNFCGTNIGATIFLSQIVSRWVDMASSSGEAIDPRVREAAIYALALGVNFGAYSFTFSASLAGLLWRSILEKNGINRIKVKQRDFALRNAPSLVLAIAISAVAILVEMIVVVK